MGWHTVMTICRDFLFSTVQIEARFKVEKRSLYPPRSNTLEEYMYLVREDKTSFALAYILSPDVKN